MAPIVTTIFNNQNRLWGEDVIKINPVTGFWCMTNSHTSSTNGCRSVCVRVCVCTRYAHSLLFFVLHLRLKAQGLLIEHAPVLLPLQVALQTVGIRCLL
jgi:hypothetical protein